ncbi:MAG: glycosyltransferase WbuB [Spirochaetaceae bacterium]|nr:MAG: glycosyltransferase WbuB [Spirochaetaceae bacterium]
MKPGDTREFAGKRILFIVENLPSPFDHRVWCEATTLRDAGARVTIICPRGKGFRKSCEIIDGITIYRHPLPEASGAMGYLLEYTTALVLETLLCLRAFVCRGFDVIHICNPPDLLFLVALPYKIAGKKIVFDHHDLNPELYIAKFGHKGIFYRLMLFFERLTYLFANQCIATNASYRGVALTRGHKLLNQVEIVRSGPATNRMKIMAPVDSHRAGKPLMAGYVGVIGKQEGLQYLVKACSYLVHIKSRTDIHFCVAGDGPDLLSVKQLAKDERVDDFFTFTGRVSDRILLEILNTADICVNPDEYNEMNDKSTMNKIMEYMALAKPIVQFDLAEGRISAGDSSLYASNNDAIDFAMKILELINDPAKRRRMGEIGYNRVKNELSWEYQKEPLKKVYRRLFGSKP